MAFIMGDSFDLAASVNDLVTSGIWTSQNASLSPVTRFSSGWALNLGSGLNVIRDGLAPSAATVYFAFALNIIGTSTFYIKGRDAGNAQFGVTFPYDGSITVTNNAGTVLTSYATGTFPQNVWNHVQIMATIDPTAGAVQIRLNGSPTPLTPATGSTSGLNTRYTTNNYLTGVSLAGTGTGSYVDDFLMFDNSGTSLNTWTGDIRCYVLYPNANTAQKNFIGSSLAATPFSTTSSNQMVFSNTLYISSPFLVSNTSVLNSVTLDLSSPYSGNINVALYDNGNVNVLGTAVALSNLQTGFNTFNFTSPPAIIGGTTYKIGILSNGNILLAGASSGSWFYSNTHTYGSGFPTGPTINGSNQPSRYIAYNTTLSNFAAVNEPTSYNGDASYVYSSTVGAEDLYTLQPLPTTPAAIIVAQLRAIARKSDAGTRATATMLVSGGSTNTGNSVYLSSNYTYLISNFPIDPNTGLPWTAAAINSLQVGLKVSA